MIGLFKGNIIGLLIVILCWMKEGGGLSWWWVVGVYICIVCVSGLMDDLGNLGILVWVFNSGLY